MILSAHQPAYLPWLGYFDKIARADVFVYLDTVQFEKNSFINRNQIKTPQGAQWLTIPVRTKGHMSASLRTTEIDDSQKWRSKHIKSIETNYRKAHRFEYCFPKIEAILNLQISNLAEYCLHQLIFWLTELEIDTQVVRSSDLEVDSSKSDLVLDLCKNLNANNYLSGAKGHDYLRADDFDNAGVTINYQNFPTPIYPQLWGDFIPNISVLDWWMNTTDHNFKQGKP